jgi:tetratricopeptide (TPR) repeat protein
MPGRFAWPRKSFVNKALRGKSLAAGIVGGCSWLACALASPETAAPLTAAAQEAFATLDFSKALDLLTRAIAEDPANPSLYANRGSCFDNLQKTGEAIRDFDAAAQKTVALSKNPQDPDLAPILYNRGIALVHAGRFKEAIADFEKSIAVDEEFPDVRNELAWILATNGDPSVRNPPKALALALAETKRNGLHSPMAADTLAAAHAANGKFDEAIQEEKEAIEQATTPLQRRKYQARLHLYENKKPFLEPR